MASKKSSDHGYGPAQKYQALWDYNGRDGDELSLVRGEIFTAKLAREEYWLIAINQKGQRGLVPENYVALVKPVQKKEKTQSDVHSSSSATCDESSSSALPPKPNLMTKTASIRQIEDWEKKVAKMVGSDRFSVYIYITSILHNHILVLCIVNRILYSHIHRSFLYSPYQGQKRSSAGRGSTQPEQQ